jgi:quercetin dioxygenase-like cupin family protein
MPTPNYFLDAQVPWTELGDGIRRKIVAHSPELMSVLVQFDEGAVGTVHSHEAHTQIAYVVSGEFEANVGGVRQTLRVGDAFIAPKLVPHGVIAKAPNSTLLDQFSPRRDDYL